MNWLKMEMSPNFSFIPGVRSCISRSAYNFGFNDREAYHIEIIIDEICNNAVEYGCKKKDGKIKLECKFYKNMMEFIVRDFGSNKFNADESLQKGFNLLQNDITKGITETPRRGRGLVIVKKLVDKLEIRSSKNGTVVRIIKKDAPKSAEQPADRAK